MLAAVAAGTTGEELFPFFTVELSSPVLNLAAAVGWSSVFATGKVLRVFRSRGGLRFSKRAEFYVFSNREAVFGFQVGQSFTCIQSRGGLQCSRRAAFTCFTVARFLLVF